MYFKSVDTDQFGFGESNEQTHKLEEACLDLGFASVDIRLIEGDYFLIDMEGWTPYMRLGSTIKDAIKSLTAMGPSHILDHADTLDDEELEELFDQAQEQRDEFEGTPEQEAQIEKDLHSHLHFTRMDSNTLPWIDQVH